MDFDSIVLLGLRTRSDDLIDDLELVVRPEDEADERARRATPEALRTSPNEAKPREWLGRRDSNPDNHVQSVVSYR